MENQNPAQLLQAAGVGAELPYTGTNSLASALSALFSGGTSTQKQSGGIGGILGGAGSIFRSEEHTSELQSLMRISYAVFCLQKKTSSTYHTSFHNPAYKQSNQNTQYTYAI